jgi:hypothetical protein
MEHYEQMEGVLPVAEVATAPHAARTVLYIEDNLSNLRLIERILEHRPAVTLISAMQGRLGWELACEHTPTSSCWI